MPQNFDNRHFEAKNRNNDVGIMLALNSSSQQPRPQGFFLRKRAAPIFLGKIAGDKVEYTIIFVG